MNLGIRITADWNKNGLFDHAHANIGAHIDPVRFNLTTERGKDQSRAFALPSPGRVEFPLTNPDGLFSAEREDSDLYGKVLPGVEVKVEAQVEAGEAIITEPDGLNLIIEGGEHAGETLGTEGGAWTTIATGRIDDIDENPMLGARYVNIKCKGNFRQLVENIISTPVYLNKTVSELISIALDAAGWSADKRSIATSEIIVPIWWAGKRDALEALNELFICEGGGSWYESAAGYAVFENRYARHTQTRSIESQFTFNSEGVTNAYIHENVNYNSGRKEVINQVAFTLKEREQQPEQQIWEMIEAFSIGPNETKVFEVTAPNSDPFSDAIIPSTSDGQSEVQKLTGNADALNSAGTMQLGFGGETARRPGKSAAASAGFNIFSSGATIQQVMRWLSTIEGDNINVTGSLAGGGLTFTFKNILASLPVDLISHSANFTTIVGEPALNVERVTEGRKPGIVVSSGSIADVNFEDDRDSGGSVILRITAGNEGATVDSIRVRAKPFTVARDHRITQTVDTSQSVTDYGAKAYPHAMWEGADPIEAQSIADMIVTLRQSPVPTFSFTSRTADATILAFMVTADISTRVTIIEPHIGISADYFIEGIDRVLDQYKLTTTWRLERVPDEAVFGNFAIVGEWDLGVDQIAA